MEEHRKALDSARLRRRDVYEAILGLEAAIAAPVRGRAWFDVVRQELEDFRDALSAHIEEVERDGGLFSSVIDAAPRLAHAVGVLEGEHVEMREAVTESLGLLTSEADDAEPVRDACMVLLGRATRHRQRGADLVWSAFDLDIGGMG